MLIVLATLSGTPFSGKPIWQTFLANMFGNPIWQTFRAKLLGTPFWQTLWATLFGKIYGALTGQTFVANCFWQTHLTNLLGKSLQGHLSG